MRRCARCDGPFKDRDPTATLCILCALRPAHAVAQEMEKMYKALAVKEKRHG